MAENKPLVVYAAAYETVEAALADLDDIEQLHKDETIGQYDAAVIDKENGKPHVVKRMDRPHIRVIPEWFGGGTRPRKELHEAAAQLVQVLDERHLPAGELGDGFLGGGHDPGVSSTAVTLRPAPR